MSDAMRNELRQIKWLLAGILACLVVIIVLMAPALIKLAIWLVAACAVGLAVVCLARYAKVLWWRWVAARR